MWNTIWWVIRLYTPPDPGDVKAMFRYHLAQSIGLLGLWVVVWTTAFWLIGDAPFMPQLAWAGQVDVVAKSVEKIAHENTKIASQLTTIQLLQLRSSLETQLKYLCQAQQAHNQQDLDNANHQLSDLTDAYFQLAGRPFTPPSCTTILVTENK